MKIKEYDIKLIGIGHCADIIFNDLIVQETMILELSTNDEKEIIAITKDEHPEHFKYIQDTLEKGENLNTYPGIIVTFICIWGGNLIIKEFIPGCKLTDYNVVEDVIDIYRRKREKQCKCKFILKPDY